MNRSKLPYFFLGLAAVLAVAALVLLLVHRPDVKPKPRSASGESAAIPPPQPEAAHGLGPSQAPGAALKTPGIAAAATDPAELVNRIAAALQAGDSAALARLIGKDALDSQTAERLAALSAAGLRLRQTDAVREIGELELNARTRWALELEGPDAGRIFLDLKRDGQKWSVENITLPPAPGAIAAADSLSVADTFLQAVLRQDFEFARALVDPATVSDTKIAGLCILFEEGAYSLRKSKPLRAMFRRADTVGFLANVEAAGAEQGAQFAITLKQTPDSSKWRVSEINLDQLLSDYARRVAGGDAYYSPLVKNPAGGDTLALYFEFDEDAISPRTRRQLEIVSSILKSDPGKKLTLSGHTDSLGAESYNRSLSERRADVVRDFLTKSGVNAAQIVTLAKGASQPRRPNVTEAGQDNPEGRRANRRTEIYLDF